jgi:hypothetical protein
MAAFTYEFGIKGIHKVSAQVVGEMIEELNNNGTEVTPELLVELSRDPSSPTHDEFEWDDTVAAQKYRTEQARQLIAHIRIVKEEDQEYKVRAFVPTPERNSVYVPLQNALNNDSYREHLLKQAKADSEIFLAKYRRLEELASVTEAMMEFLKLG